MQRGAFCFVIIVMAAWCSFAACKKHHTVTRGFYYWKTVYRPTAYEVEKMRELHAGKMYIRLCDVDWDYRLKHEIPVAPVSLPQYMDTALSYVPVIFITQRTLTNIPDSAIPRLAANIAALAKDQCANAGINPAEIQIDFDWTVNTRKIYFKLLQELRNTPFLKGKTLSCTIRLHQVKYTSSSGIPPVDKGLLMCYNIGDIKNAGTHNSILDAAIAESYLANLDAYPLNLDIALPLFSWVLQFRGAELKGILRDIAPETVASCSIFEHITDNRYRCRQDTLWNGYYLSADDMVRVETSATADIERVAAYTSKHISNTDLNVVFFHCDSLTLSKFSFNELEKIYSAYR